MVTIIWDVAVPEADHALFRSRLGTTSHLSAQSLSPWLMPVCAAALSRLPRSDRSAYRSEIRTHRCPRNAPAPIVEASGCDGVFPRESECTLGMASIILSFIHLPFCAWLHPPLPSPGRPRSLCCHPIFPLVEKYRPPLIATRLPSLFLLLPRFALKDEGVVQRKPSKRVSKECDFAL